MEINNEKIYREAKAILASLYGEHAQFRAGQYEAIEATLLHHRTVVVQRTGWGKSLVYFLCTKLLRSYGAGVTVVVSPLLVLMQNQIEAAQRLHLRCEALNSQVKERREEIIQKIVDESVDLVLVTPETLFREDVQSKLPQMKISLFVIDEAHCISDWGHDFRLEYGRLKEVLQRIPTNVLLLATTATANDRVVEDLKAQFGDGVFVSRGPLTRESLAIQVLHMKSQAERYAWILQNVPKLPGSGIIYCLTRRDCDYLTRFLMENGISAMSYYSRSGLEEEKNIAAEEAFKQNRIKAIVATVKLGMGYDKGDVSFVIHFQMPANIVSYYQQIGRAGRDLDRAYVFLMSGQEDQEILNYFIRTAFPTEKETRQILDYIQQQEGAGISDLEAALNIQNGRIKKALTFLLHDGFLYKEKSRYYVSPKPFVYDAERYAAITQMRYREMEQMQELVSTRQCYSQFIVNALDDREAAACGHCANCLGRPIIPEEVAAISKERAVSYLGGLQLTIEPRKQWAAATGRKRMEYQNQPGICLSRYGDPGYGELVARDKYASSHRFCDELVGKSAKILRPWIQEHQIRYMTCVPSLRSDLVENFARRLASSCKLTFVPLLQKTHARQQKHMENSAHQCANALESFSVLEGAVVPEKVLLVDDVVDSRWTLTVCGYRLMEQGCQEVFPFALADSSQKEG